MTDRPVYEAVTWPEEDWWLVRVTGVSAGGDPVPVGYLTQAKSLTDTEPMVLDLIACVLDADDAAGFDVTIRQAAQE
jgi:hypothetical protein